MLNTDDNDADYDAGADADADVCADVGSYNNVADICGASNPFLLNFLLILLAATHVYLDKSCFVVTQIL